MTKLTYAMISTEIRRDLEDPLQYFQQLRLLHFYTKSHILEDMTSEDFKERTIHYAGPADLRKKLDEANPDIVQGVEPFAFRVQPNLKAVSDYISDTKKPLVLTSCDNLPFRRKYLPVAWYFEPTMRRIIKQARLILYINDGARDNFLTFGAKPEQLVRAMYGTWGVDPDEYSPEGPKIGEAEGISDSDQVILFVGRLVPIKGVFDLLNAFILLAPSLKNAKLVFVGAGESEEKLKQLASEKGLADRVLFLGLIKNREVARYMRRADVFVAPSVTSWLWAEQVGMVLIQAMGCGIPVVSTVSGSVPEFIEDGKVGLLVPEHSPVSLTAAIRRILTDDALHQSMSTNARAVTLEKYDASKNVLQAEQWILQYCS